MKNNIYFSTFLCSILIGNFIGCSPKRETPIPGEEKVYKLTKIDSFQVNNFTRINILDYDPKEKIFLGYSLKEDDILEISENGKIINRANKKGDGPGNYGNWNPIGLGFGPSGERIVELPFQVISYDQKYEMEQQHRIMSPLPIRANSPLGKPAFYQTNDTTFLLVGPSNYLSATNLIYNQEGKDTLQNFYQLNLRSGAVKSVIPYEPNSIYNSTNEIYPELMGKAFFVDHENNELVLVHNLDDELVIYNLPDLIKKRVIPITHSEFQTYSPVPIGTPFSDRLSLIHKQLSARNQKLFKLEEGHYILQYFTGITEAEYESRTSEEAPYIGSLDPQEQRLLIFKDGKQISQELLGIEGNLILSLPDDKLLVQEHENSEIEEEYTRFSIYQLQTN